MPRITSHYQYIPRFKFNYIIRILTLTDSLVWAGYFMNNAIVAIYLADKIDIDPIRAIGFGYAIFLISRSLFQIPIAKLLDDRGASHELFAIMGGGTLMAISFFSYLFISHEYHLYLIQAIFGIGAATYLPAWRKNFARYGDSGNEGSDWAIYDTIATLSAAGLTAFAAYVVNKTDDYSYLFFIASFLAMIGSMAILVIFKAKKD